MLAHGLTGRADLPIPIATFYWAAAIALGVSFAILGLGWRRPRLSSYRVASPRVLTGLARAGWLHLTIQLLGLCVLAAAVASLFAAGTDVPADVLAPTLVFVIFWVGIAPLSAVTGNLWSRLHPLRPVARLLRAQAGSTGRLPDRAGVFIAAAGLLVFAWLELVYPTASEFTVFGSLIVGYLVITVAGMWWAGIDDWLDRADPFATYTGLLALLSPFEQRAAADGPTLVLRPPLVGATTFLPAAGIVLLMGTMIGTVSFDGFGATTWYQESQSRWLADLGERGWDISLARDLIRTGWLVAFVAVASLLFGVFAELCGVLGRLRRPAGGYQGAFAHSLVPIALAYVIAHYFSYLVFQGQGLIALASDPLGRGWDLFGTAGHEINYSIVGPEAIWYIQVGAIVAGHVAGLVLAHDRALELAASGTRAGSHTRVTLSQVPMLALMLCFTLAGMWFLSEGLR